MTLNQQLAGYNVILASLSPRRRELLAGCDIDFSLATGYDVQEIYPDTLATANVPQFLAKLKSNAYPVPLKERDILITADTIVALQGQVVGKPDGVSGAVETLRRLSGNKHSVITGVVVRTASRTIEFSVTTDVWFRELTEQEIEYYVERYKPLDKAGAYGIQEWIGYTAIERIEGSFYNVMGLPTRRLWQALEEVVATH